LHGEAVHRAVGEGGHVALGDDVLGQHAAERVLDRDVLGGERAHRGEHLRARLVDREGHGQIIAVVGRRRRLEWVERRSSHLWRG
jgi:hypothetical protein